jgi:hypothetical protein
LGLTCFIFCCSVCFPPLHEYITTKYNRYFRGQNYDLGLFFLLLPSDRTLFRGGNASVFSPIYFELGVCLFSEMINKILFILVT